MRQTWYSSYLVLIFYFVYYYFFALGKMCEKNVIDLFPCQVNRSTALLRSLSHEGERWQTGSESFKAQMATILGDVLLSSAFMAYAGYFDQQMRQNLFNSWASHLQAACIKYRADIARVEVDRGYLFKTKNFML